MDLERKKRAKWYPDYLRATDDEDFVLKHFIRDFVFYHRLRFVIYLRKAQFSKLKMVRLFFSYKLYRYSRKYGIEIKPDTVIGKGFVLNHPYNITVSRGAVIGDNVTMLKGSTIGMSGGKKRGVPKIGNKVYIGINSTIVGGIEVGDDVVIAPNTFVNQDIPCHSIVIGNPCIVIHKANATAPYIWKTV